MTRRIGPLFYVLIIEDMQVAFIDEESFFFFVVNSSSCKGLPNFKHVRI